MSSRGPRLWWLLLGVDAVLLAVPLGAVAGLQIYDTYLMRQTERQLIAQAVVVGELFRELWLEEQGLAQAKVPAFRPPGRVDDAFVPIEPLSDLRAGLLPPQPTELPQAPLRLEAANRAGARMEPLLRRTQVFNLTALRVLDRQGCVVATTRGEGDRCLTELPEVSAALAGRYHAVARERISDEPLPPISDVRSRGSIRMFVALPIFSDGEVIAVVRASRTSLDALTSLWSARRGLLTAASLSLGATLLLSLLCAALVVVPMRRLGRLARAVAAGEQPTASTAALWTPREVRSLEESFLVMAQQLRARADEIGEWAAMLSHELKTPITAIRGAAELLDEQWDKMTAEQRHTFIRNIDADGARLERLARQMLELARIENAPPASERSEVPALLRAVAERYAGRVEVRLGALPASRPCAADHLTMILVNLLENALRYGAPPVILSAEARGEKLLLRVADHGAGLPATVRHRLFERFVTTQRDAGGTGLGLAIVRAIVTRYGGEVRLLEGGGDGAGGTAGATGGTGAVFEVLI